MSRAEKIRIKASAAEEMADLLRKGKEHEARTGSEAHAVLQVLDSVMEQILALQKRADEMFEKEEYTKEQYEAVKNHGAAMFNVVAKAARLTEVQKAAAPLRAEGLHRALQIVDMYFNQKMKQADQAEQVDADLDSPEEDAERQSRIEARRQRAEVWGPSLPDATPTADHAPPQEAATAAPQEAPPQVADTAAHPHCAHCGDEILLPTGGKWCSACTSYKNKNRRLPPKAELAQRKAATPERS